MQLPARLPIWKAAFAAAIVAAASACSESTDPVTPPGECSSAADIASCVPSWTTYSPKLADKPPEVTGTPIESEVTQSLQRIDSTGNTITLSNVTFVCTDSTFNFVENPEKAVSFNLDQTKIWPGALIQGKSHRDGSGMTDLQELPIRERAPVTVTLSFNNQDNTRVVQNPEQGSVNQAIGSMIGNAQAEGLATANNIDYQSEIYSSEKQAALAFSVSGRYLGFEASATGSVSRSATTNVVTAKFIQQMYIAGVTQPATPAAVFSDAFTPALYQQQAGLDRIGPDNPPLYVSRIGYGRMMVFSMSAHAESNEIKGALQAAYTGIGAGGGGQLSARHSAILRDAEIRITQVGGDQGNALNAIHSGNLADYFTNTAPLTSAAPLWFELKALTGEVAHVSEPGTYTQSTCKPKLPGTFEYKAEQVLSIPFTAGTQRQTVQADVNGDGRMDLVFNERRSAPAINRVHVALGASDGTFALQSPADNSNAAAEGWENYTLLVADIDGDGRDDLVWNTLGTNNVVYAGMADGAGTFVWRGRQQHTNNAWTTYRATTADLNGDGRTDILWNNAGGNPTTLRSYFGLAQPDSTLSMIANFVDKAGDYSGYRPAVAANFDGSQGDGFVVNAVGATFNNSYVGLFSATSATTGTLTFPAPLVYGSSGWTNYVLRVGDVDGENSADLVFVNTTNGAIHRAMNKGNGTFAVKPPQTGDITTGVIEPFLADFNNDGHADLLEMRRTASLNQISVGFGVADGSFTFPAGVQTHPATPSIGWQPFQVLVGDVNGDNKADVVWSNPAGDARIYVALAK